MPSERGELLHKPSHSNGNIFLRIAICACISLFVGSGTLLFAIDNTEPPAAPLIPMVRAMGSAYTAVADDENAVYYNPAGYGTIEDSIISVFSLGIKLNVDNSALDLYRALISGDDITAPANISTYLNNTTVAPGIAGPIYFGRVGNNFGFSFYDNVSFRLSTRPGAILPTAELVSCSDIGFVGGYGAELPFLNGLYAGINMKVILRVKSQIDGTVLDVIDSVGELSDIPLAKAVGFGSDVGLLYKPLPWINFGVTAKDFFGTRFTSWDNLTSSGESFSDSSIKPRIAFGTAFHLLELFGRSKAFNDLVIALDYSDLLDYSSALSNIKFGVRFNTLGVINLLGGIDGGYLAGGIGFDLKFFNLGLAYYVDELGAYPGARPVQNLMLTFGLQW